MTHPLKHDREDQFLSLWNNFGDRSIQWTREFVFHSTRKWRFDFAHESTKTAVEIEGVTYFGSKRSRHQTTKGFVNDIDKYNCAVELGWRVLRYSQVDLEKRPIQIIEQIRSVLSQAS